MDLKQKYLRYHSMSKHYEQSVFEIISAIFFKWSQNICKFYIFILIINKA